MGAVGQKGGTLGRPRGADDILRLCLGADHVAVGFARVDWVVYSCFTRCVCVETTHTGHRGIPE